MGGRMAVGVPIAIPHSRPWITESDYAAVELVMRGDMIAQGERVVAFENAVGRMSQTSGGVAVACGAAALAAASPEE